LSARFDIVTHMHGLNGFEEEYPHALEYDLEGIRVPVLPLKRVIASKKASARPRDLAHLPALEEALAVIEDKNEKRQPE
jgi:hypothetical protein